MQRSFDIGAAHPFSWPKINGFHTSSSAEEMVHHLKANKVWNVTEKLDGSNVCISTQGWISSKKQIISNRDNPKTVFQNVGGFLHLKSGKNKCCLYFLIILGGLGQSSEPDSRVARM